MPSNNISVVVPLFNEQASLVELHQEITAVADEHAYNIEVIYVDDGSTDGS